MPVNNILNTEFCFMTALTSVGNVRLCVRFRRFTDIFGLGQKAVEDMIRVVPSREEELFITIIVRQGC